MMMMVVRLVAEVRWDVGGQLRSEFWKQQLSLWL